MIPFRKALGPLAAALGLAASLACGTSCSEAQKAEPQRLASIEWPRQYADAGDTVVVYDPQIDSWEKYEKLAARSAVSVKAKGSIELVYGVMEYTVGTEISSETKEVLFKNRTFTAVRFKGLEASKAAQAEGIVRRVLKADQNTILPLAFVLAQMEADAKAQPSVTVNLEPPPIFSADAPAVMVMVLGKPEFKSIKGTDIEFCVNTNWDLFRHPGTSEYYLLNGEGWLTTKSLKGGPWASATSLPAALSSLPADDNWAEVRKHVPGKKISVCSALRLRETPSEA